MTLCKSVGINVFLCVYLFLSVFVCACVFFVHVCVCVCVFVCVCVCVCVFACIHVKVGNRVVNTSYKWGSEKSGYSFREPIFLSMRHAEDCHRINATSVSGRCLILTYLPVTSVLPHVYVVLTALLPHFDMSEHKREHTKPHFDLNKCMCVCVCVCVCVCSLFSKFKTIVRITIMQVDI